MKTLQNLYLHELQVLYSAERRIKSALPQFIQAAKYADLKTALKAHLEATQRHIQRLNEILSNHATVYQELTCPGVHGLLEECQNLLLLENEDLVVRDLALIARFQRVEHYEIAGYASLRAFAEQLGHYDDVALLTETLEEESGMDDELTSAAILLLCECDSLQEPALEADTSSGHDRLGQTSFALL